MSAASTAPDRVVPEPIPENLRSVQPGGGVCYRVELAWGRWRRWYLKRFRPGYVKRMARLRQGDSAGAPHEILDPRDLKFCRNRVSCRWDPSDDPFAWRDKIPLARWGLAEVQVMGWPLLLLAVLLGWYNWLLAVPPVLLLVFVAWFFRDPPRRIPPEPGVIVSPADGKVVEVTRLERDEFVGGPAVRIGIFLSIFNVHLNRSPAACRVLALRYSPGEFLSALDPRSALRNENLWIGLEEEAPPHRKFVVRQIAGAIARRIVCPLRPGDGLIRGEKIGMIKLGSRTELILAEDKFLTIEARPGDRVRGGTSVLARYRATNHVG
jgi:phosphatidylserine decarboxylase